MKIITNNKIIQRNRKIGSISTITGFLLLAGGLYISLSKPELLIWSYSALIGGFIASQVGIRYSTHFGRSPRTDELLSLALKGLDNKYSLYNYSTAVSHLLIGPAGIWILIPYLQGGTITYDRKKKRWRQVGGNLYMKIFGQENLGRPDRDINTNVEDLNQFLKKVQNEETIPPLNIALVFLNEKASIQAQDAPVVTLPSVKLKNFIRQKAREYHFPMEMVQKFTKLLPGL